MIDIHQTHFKCYCGEQFISESNKAEIRHVVCQDLPFYKEFEGKQYCVLHYPSQDKIEVFEKVFQRRLENNEWDFRGVWFPQKVELLKYDFEQDINFEKAVFSDEVDFTSAKFSANAKFSSAIFKAKAKFHLSAFSAEANFYSAVFFDTAYFTNITFSVNANFYEVKFKSAIFSQSCFSVYTTFESAEFELADFNQTKFSGLVLFDYAVFFDESGFLPARFQLATFEGNSHLMFVGTTFNFAVMFNYAIFKGYVYFKGETEVVEGNVKGNISCFEKDSVLHLKNARFEKPECISFHSVRLRPHWFVNVDPRKFVFINVDWGESLGSLKYIKAELEAVRENNPHHLLAIAYRQLATNYEENNRYEEASYFRRMAFETEWLEKKERFWNSINRLPDESGKLKRRVGDTENKEDESIPPTNSFGIIQRFDFVHLLYRVTSYYGESWRWALSVFIGIWFAFAIIYTQVNFSVCSQDKTVNPQNIPKPCERGLSISEAMKHSFGTMFLQKSETRTPLGAAETFVLIESVLAPLQAALLALAIRRKFMR